MSYEILKAHATWFNAQSEKLEAAAIELDCIGEKIMAVNYDWTESYRFAPFKPAYNAMRTALTSGPGGADKGITLLEKLEATVVASGKDYLRAEAAAENLTQEINALIDQLDF